MTNKTPPGPRSITSTPKPPSKSESRRITRLTKNEIKRVRREGLQAKRKAPPIKKSKATIADVDVNRTQPLQDPGKKVVRYYIVIINWIEHDKLATVSSIHEWHQSCFKMIEPTCNDLPSPLVIHPTIGEYTLVSQENQFNNF